MASDERTPLMNAICDHFGVSRVMKGEGSSVMSDFIDTITRASGIDPGAYPNKYRRFEALLGSVGERYDPQTDTSEWSKTGGGTITNVGLEKLLGALRR